MMEMHPVRVIPADCKVKEVLKKRKENKTKTKDWDRDKVKIMNKDWDEVKVKNKERSKARDKDFKGMKILLPPRKGGRGESPIPTLPYGKKTRFRLVRL